MVRKRGKSRGDNSIPDQGGKTPGVAAAASGLPAGQTSAARPISDPNATGAVSSGEQSALYTAGQPDDEFDPERLGMVNYGTSGLRRYSGYIFEEFLSELTGKNACRVYKEMAYNDPIVASLIFAIKMCSRKVEWIVEPATDDKKDEEVAEFIEQCMDDTNKPWKEIITEIFSMVQYGHAPMEITYKYRKGRDVEEEGTESKFTDGMIGWRSINLRAADTILRWEFWENGEIRGLWQLAPPYWRLTYIPQEKFLLFRTDYSKNNPEGRSVLRGAYRPWLFKKYLEEIESIGAERGVAGIPVAWVPSNIAAPDPTDTNATAALQSYKDLVSNIRRDAQEGIVFPLVYDEKGNKLFDLTLLTTEGSNGRIGEIITRKSNEILQVCLAEFVMLGTQRVGSFAMSQTKVDLFMQSIGVYLDLIAEVFNSQAIPRLLELNPKFGKLEELPRISHTNIQETDLKELAAYISQLVAAGVLQPDNALSDYVRAAASLPDAMEELPSMEEQRSLDMDMKQQEMDIARAKAGVDQEKEEPVVGGKKEAKKNEKPK